MYIYIYIHTYVQSRIFTLFLNFDLKSRFHLKLRVIRIRPFQLASGLQAFGMAARWYQGLWWGTWYHPFLIKISSTMGGEHIYPKHQVIAAAQVDQTAALVGDPKSRWSSCFHDLKPVGLVCIQTSMVSATPIINCIFIYKPGTLFCNLLVTWVVIIAYDSWSSSGSSKGSMEQTAPRGAKLLSKRLASAFFLSAIGLSLSELFKL